MMITAIQQSFLEARTVLPPVAHFDGDMIIISVGAYRGEWGQFHVFTIDETMHFVFLKRPVINQWICADTGLQRWLDEHNECALTLLESV